MNEASNLSIGVDEKLTSFCAVAPVPMLTCSLQDRYLFRPRERSDLDIDDMLDCQEVPRSVQRSPWPIAGSCSR
jgi:hypothetical protein